MNMDSCRIYIKTLENGYSVEVPDYDAMEEKQAKAKKSKGAVDSYMGDCTKTYAAKSVVEVIKLVKASLEKMPDTEFESAFEEASKAS